jgi:hypothetical protein
VAQDRLLLIGEAQVLVQLRHRWTDETTHLRFDPIEFLERLAALTPRPRINGSTQSCITACWRPRRRGDRCWSAGASAPTIRRARRAIGPTASQPDRAERAVSYGPT